VNGRALAQLLLVAFLASTPVLAPACKTQDPPNRPVDLCTVSCAAKAARQCSEVECNRGCQFILDRLAEGEGEHVIACVAKRENRCADLVWAECAARIGLHADGGPPAPPPPSEEWE
jgi:hypothetical protein